MVPVLGYGAILKQIKKSSHWFAINFNIFDP